MLALKLYKLYKLVLCMDYTGGREVLFLPLGKVGEVRVTQLFNTTLKANHICLKQSTHVLCNFGPAILLVNNHVIKNTFTEYTAGISMPPAAQSVCQKPFPVDIYLPSEVKSCNLKTRVLHTKHYNSLNHSTNTNLFAFN